MRLRLFLIISTFVQVSILVLTYILDRSKSNWLCGPSLLFLGFFIVLFQLLIAVAGWSVKEKSKSNALKIVSTGLLVLLLIGFINFLTRCS
jgi:sugar phosphate permease